MEIKNFEEIIEEGIKLIIQNWPVLQLAIENCWNNKYKKHALNKKSLEDLSPTEQKEEFSNQLITYIITYDVQKEDIEYFLLNFMEDNYSVEVGDDSEKYIASLVMRLISDASDGQTSVLEEFHQKAKEIQALKLQNTLPSSEQKSVKENQIKTEEKFEKFEPVVDQDGFILVQTKKKDKKQEKKD